MGGVYNYVSNFLEDFNICPGARECGICGQLATVECKNCYSHFGKEMATISFCKKCSYNVRIS